MKIFSSHKIAIFLIILVLFLILYPYLHEYYPEHILITECSLAILMTSGVSIFLEKSYQKISSILLAVLVLLGVWLASYVKYRWIIVSTLCIEFIFFSFILVSMVKYVFRQRTITLNKLLAAICAYLILGLLFAIFYTIIFTIHSGAFILDVSNTFINTSLYPHPAFFTEAIYFSFVTLSTLGYGDLIPTFGPLKIIASLEAISGQLFIAILIARLVGLHIIYTNKSNN